MRRFGKVPDVITVPHRRTQQARLRRRKGKDALPHFTKNSREEHAGKDLRLESFYEHARLHAPASISRILGEHPVSSIPGVGRVREFDQPGAQNLAANELQSPAPDRLLRGEGTRARTLATQADLSRPVRNAPEESTKRGTSPNKDPDDSNASHSSRRSSNSQRPDQFPDSSLRLRQEK